MLHRFASLQDREEQVFLVLALVIGALTGLAVVAFIVLTERMGMRLYPAGGSPWRRLLFPTLASLAMGYLLFRYFPNARQWGSTDQGRPLRAGRAHHHEDGVRKVLLHVGNLGMRHPTGTRGAVGPGGGRPRFSPGPPPGIPC